MSTASVAPSPIVPLSAHELDRLSQWLQRSAGIHLAANKRELVTGRLERRLRTQGLASYGAYFDLIESGENADESRIALDLLTTNETSFFREEKHFDHLRRAATRGGSPFRVWSAACSSGEEPYTIAMVLAEVLGSRAWEVLGTDISTRMVERARSACYPMERASRIPAGLLKRYCLRGTGPAEGTFRIARSLRDRVQIQGANLLGDIPGLPRFNVIFLRNVMIYFDLPTKCAVVDRLLRQLVPGGLLLVGHAETLTGVRDDLQAEAPSVYRKLESTACTALGSAASTRLLPQRSHART